MAIRHSITLSTSEPNNEVGNLKIRQGDEQTQTLVANITENGVPKPFTGLQPFFCAKLGQTAGLGIIEQKVTGTMNPANGTLEYVMQPEDWQQLGRQTAYFSFRKMVNDHEWTEQFSTRDFNYNVIKSAFSEGLREVKKDGSTYVWTIEDLIRLFNEYMASGKTDWEEFVEQNREVLESVDPGGKLIGELIDARRPFGGEAYPTLGERLDNDKIEIDAQIAQVMTLLSNFPRVVPEFADSPRIQRAIDATPAGTVKLEPIEYSINAEVNVKDNITLLGDSNLLTILKATSNFTGSGIFKSLTNIKNLCLKNITLDGNKSLIINKNVSLLNFGTNGIKNGEFENIVVTNSPYHGAFFGESCESLFFKNCRFEGNAVFDGGNGHGAGIYMSYVNDVFFEKCYFNGNFEHGCYAAGGFGYKYETCLFENNGGSGLSSRTSNTDINNITAKGNGTEGIGISSSSYGRLYDVKLRNSKIFDNLGLDHEVVVSDDFEGVLIENNVIGGINSTAPRGLLVLDANALNQSKNLNITNNKIQADIPIVGKMTNLDAIKINDNTLISEGSYTIDITPNSTLAQIDVAEIKNNLINCKKLNTAAPFVLRSGVNIDLLAYKENNVIDNARVDKAEINILGTIKTKDVSYYRLSLNYVTDTEKIISPNNTTFISINMPGFGYSGLISVFPARSLPGGLSFYACPRGATDLVNLAIVNNTNTQITLPISTGFFLEGEKNI